MVHFRELGVTGAAPLPRHFKGKQLQFFDDPAIDTLLRIVLELVQEQWVTRERLMLLEKLISAETGLAADAIESLRLDDADMKRAAAERDAYVQRIFAVLDRPRN